MIPRFLAEHAVADCYYYPRMRGDLELLDAWRGGDSVAGNSLIERHFDRLYRFFFTKVPSDAEDLVQDTLLACVQAHQRCAEESDFPAFMIGIARNKLLTYWRRRSSREQALDFDVVCLEALGMNAPQVIAEREEQRLLLRALRSIPVEHQILMELFYWEALSGPQLALALKIPEGTVRGRLRRAKTLLHRKIEELGSGPDLVRSTLDSLGVWAESMRRRWAGAAEE